MDFNDINNRLRRIYSSIDKSKKYGAEALLGMRTEKIDKPDGKFGIKISFGDHTEATNQILSVISLLADLKDILKNSMEMQGNNKQLIEDEINNSPALQVVLDLSNQEKHGYPLKHWRRSKKDPLIKNIRTGMGISDKPDNIRYSMNDGSAVYNVMITINAEIVDSNGQHLYTLDELVGEAIDDWERIIRTYQII